MEPKETGRLTALMERNWKTIRIDGVDYVTRKNAESLVAALAEELAGLRNYRSEYGHMLGGTEAPSSSRHRRVETDDLRVALGQYLMN